MQVNERSHRHRLLELCVWSEVKTTKVYAITTAAYIGNEPEIQLTLERCESDWMGDGWRQGNSIHRKRARDTAQS